MLEPNKTQHLPLSDEQLRLLGEAKRRAETVRRGIESSIVEYGRWLLGHVFEDDLAAATAAKMTKNPVWCALLEAAGGRGVRLSARFIYVALMIAVHDRRIDEAAWQRLDISRKEALLPLRDEVELREGARQAARHDFTIQKTREYVAARREELGATRTVRLTPAGLAARLRRMRTAFGGQAIVRRVRRLSATLDETTRADAVAEIGRVRAVLRQLEQALARR